MSLQSENFLAGTICERLDASKKSWKETWSSNRVVVKNLIIIHQWGEGHFEQLPKSMIIDLRQTKMWASGTGAVLEKIGKKGTLGIASVIERLDSITEYHQIKKAVRNIVDTIKDDTKNKPDTGK